MLPHTGKGTLFISEPFPLWLCATWSRDNWTQKLLSQFKYLLRGQLCKCWFRRRTLIRSAWRVGLQVGSDLSLMRIATVSVCPWGKHCDHLLPGLLRGQAGSQAAGMWSPLEQWRRPGSRAEGGWLRYSPFRVMDLASPGVDQEMSFWTTPGQLLPLKAQMPALLPAHHQITGLAAGAGDGRRLKTGWNGKLTGGLCF